MNADAAQERAVALAALEQYGWGLRAPGEHHRTGRTLDGTRAWAEQAVGLSSNLTEDTQPPVA